jgi:hypothetical protein
VLHVLELAERCFDLFEVIHRARIIREDPSASPPSIPTIRRGSGCFQAPLNAKFLHLPTVR